MRLWEIRDKDGRTCAIEVPSTAGRRRVVRIVESVQGVEITSAVLKRFSRGPEVFCRFRLEGEMYEISEPFGDNSRFLVGKPKFGWNANFARVVEGFRAAGLWFGPVSRRASATEQPTSADADGDRSSC